jgi:hypothetical protein
VALFPSTLPVLWKGTLIVVVAVPPVFSNVPVLLKALVPVPPPLLKLLSLAKFQTLPERALNTAPFSMVILPAVPDQTAVPLRFMMRFERTTLGEPVVEIKLIPALAFVVAFVPTTHDAPLRDEHMNPPVQFRTVEKFKTPGAAPPMAPFVRFTVLVETVVVAVPKFMVAPLKFTVPVPLMGPLCEKMLALKLMEAPAAGV